MSVASRGYLPHCFAVRQISKTSHLQFGELLLFIPEHRLLELPCGTKCLRYVFVIECHRKVICLAGFKWGIHTVELMTNVFPLHVFNKKENFIFHLPGTFKKNSKKERKPVLIANISSLKTHKKIANSQD